MPKKDPRIDAYIAKSADFARPVLNHLRKLIHQACPDVEETIKWGFPHFLHHGILCSTAAFKAHCAFILWKGALILEKGEPAKGMGQFGKITELSDLPNDKTIIGYLKRGMELNKDGVQVPERQKQERKDLVVPRNFAAELKKNKKALTTFENFSYTHKKEYVEWIEKAKAEPTRLRRLATAMEWLSEGKPRNWKYMKR